MTTPRPPYIQDRRKDKETVGEKTSKRIETTRENKRAGNPDYHNGRWSNRVGKTIGYSKSEDSPMIPITNKGKRK